MSADNVVSLFGDMITLEGKAGMWHCMQFDLINSAFSVLAILQ
jgi:hypothetical protein